jgi:predicted anti-sigma-YlaC factor YlaD
VGAMKKILWAMLVCLAVIGSGCSVKRVAVNKVGNALAGSGTTFASDDDPELIKTAVPFSLKLMESLLNENPRHEGLLLGTCRGFTQYAYAFVQEDADERAMALSGGQQAGPMVSFAEAVCVQKQDLKEFESLLKRALAINPDARPEWRLANLVMQRRAKWLLARTDQLFLHANPSEGKKTQ